MSTVYITTTLVSKQVWVAFGLAFQFRDSTVSFMKAAPIRLDSLAHKALILLVSVFSPTHLVR